MANENQDLPKKCFCVRCFLPIDENDKVEIDGQNFHRLCGTCCICRHIPLKLKMFYGHVFCEDCFKTFVLTRLRGESPQLNADSWWMQFAPGVKAQHSTIEGSQPPKAEAKSPPAPECGEGKRCVCARCLQAVDEADKVEIAGQTFHCGCAKCCSCHQVPKDNIKIYCGQVFCEACFNQHILSRNRDNPSEFFRSCFEQWQTNPGFAEHMKMFMESSQSAHSPLVFMAPPSCRVSAEREEVESKSATPPATTVDPASDLFDTRTEVSNPMSQNSAAAAEKIEKLTKYLRGSNFNTEIPKKWKTAGAALAPASDWNHLKGSSVSSHLSCPKCLWQSGSIYVNREL